MPFGFVLTVFLAVVSFTPLVCQSVCIFLYFVLRLFVRFYVCLFVLFGFLVVCGGCGCGGCGCGCCCCRRPHDCWLLVWLLFAVSCYVCFSCGSGSGVVGGVGLGAVDFSCCLLGLVCS